MTISRTVSVSILVSCALILASDRRADLERALSQLETSRAAAMVRGDSVSFSEGTADEYTLITTRGQLEDKRQVNDALESKSIDLTAYKVSNVKTRIYGNVAILTGRADIRGKIAGEAIEHPMMFTRVYVNENGKWLCVALQQTSIETEQF